MSINVVSHMHACSVNRDLIHDKESLEGHSVETVATG
jgi:urease beta subunit